MRYHLSYAIITAAQHWFSRWFIIRRLYIISTWHNLLRLTLMHKRLPFSSSRSNMLCDCIIAINSWGLGSENILDDFWPMSSTMFNSTTTHPFRTLILCTCQSGYLRGDVLLVWTETSWFLWWPTLQIMGYMPTFLQLLIGSFRGVLDHNLADLHAQAWQPFCAS